MEGINIVSWNVRGICSDVARANVRQLLMESRANILLLQQTKCLDWSQHWSDVFWRGADNECLVCNAVGQSGGLATSWLSLDFQVISTFKSRHWIWVRGKFNGYMVNIVNIYGPLKPDLKIAVWGSLQELVSSFYQEPICLKWETSIVSVGRRTKQIVITISAIPRDLMSFLLSVTLWKSRILKWIILGTAQITRKVD